MNRRWIIDAVGGEATFERLAREMAGSDLWSVLMEVVRERARGRAPSQLLAQYRRDPFVQPAPIDQRTFVELDGHLLAAAEAFDAVELSPVAPLGACSVVALTDQHRILSALRSTEVVSDPTNILALECAARLAQSPERPVRLATSQRVLRAQQLPKVPGYTQHFRLFALATAGPKRKEHALVVDAMGEHVRTMLRALDRLEAHGYAFGARRVDILTTPERVGLGERMVDDLKGLAAVALKPLEHAYYSGGIRYLIWVTDPAGGELPVVDGGAFEWLERLTGNRRHGLVTSGMGTQLVALRFRRQGG